MPRGSSREGRGSRGGMTVQEAGRKGGETVLHERGPEFFSEIGRKGGQKVRDLIAAGKRGQAGTPGGSHPGEGR
jgi:general stress protein YciG